jgi:hypothetical protein
MIDTFLVPSTQIPDTFRLTALAATPLNMSLAPQASMDNDQLGEPDFRISLLRSVGGIYPDVTIEEEHADQLVVTDHPVQGAARGNASISDHAYKLPAEVVITYGWSPGGAGNATSSSTYLNDIYGQILNLQNTRAIFDVYTGRRVYNNMILQAVSMTTDRNTENALIVRLSCREVIFVQTQVVRVSTDPSTQTNPQRTQATVQRGDQPLQPGGAFNQGARTGLSGIGAGFEATP